MPAWATGVACGAGVGHKPALDLSFLKHDFGPCLVHQRGMQPQEVKLHLRNNDKAELNFSIEWVMSCAPAIKQPWGSEKLCLRPILSLPGRE